jgi:hypothetical protein
MHGPAQIRLIAGEFLGLLDRGRRSLSRRASKPCPRKRRPAMNPRPTQRTPFPHISESLESPVGLGALSALTNSADSLAEVQSFRPAALLTSGLPGVRSMDLGVSGSVLG